MSKKSAAFEAKFEIAVKTLLKAPNLTVSEAMLVAKFSAKDIADSNIRRNVSRRIPGGKRAMAALLPPALLTPSIVDVSPSCLSPQISDLTTLSGDDGGDTAIAGRIQPPKRKQQRMTASALQQKRVEDLKQKRHKVDAHKEAVRLYTKELEKPAGARMSSKQVQDHVQKRYGVAPSSSTIQRYTKEGMVNVSPKKMGPSGILSEGVYRLLCEALSSLIPINGMNARSGDNVRKKFTTMLVKTMDMDSIAAGKLLDRLLRDTATDIHAEKLNCAEDRRVRWTTYQNLKLWFDSWEKFLVEFGFATYDADGEFIIDEELMHRILNMDETCISLDGSNGNRGGRPTVTYMLGHTALTRT